MTINVSQFKCPNCGAAVPFDPTTQNLKCEHCGCEFDIDNLKKSEAEQNSLSDSFNWNEYNDSKIEEDDKISYVCPSCGGELIGDKTLSASNCPYCGNSVIIENKFKGMSKPDLVIPFKYTKNEAKDAFYNFLKNKYLLPNDFKADTVIEKINGLYAPYWLFDCDCNCEARYKATRINTFRSGDYQITKTSHFMVYRDGTISFSNVPVDGSSKLDNDLTESLEPYDFKQGVDFNTAYLSGFFSEQYDVDSKEAITRANERIKFTTESQIRATVIGYSTVIPTSSAVQFDNGKIKYALLPCYIFSAKYKDKVYTFAMNGQTGKFVGNLPSDNKKAFKIGLITFLISFIIIGLIGYFFIV